MWKTGEILRWSGVKNQFAVSNFGCALHNNGVARDATALAPGAEFKREVRFFGVANESEVAAAFHGFHHGDFVGVFEVGTDWDAYSDARNAHAEWLR